MASLDFRVGCYAPDFELPGIDGSVHHLRQYLTQFQIVGVVFLSYDCHGILPALQHLTSLQSDFTDRGVTLVGIDSDHGSGPLCDRLHAMATFAHHHQLPFPYLRDETQEVAETFGATHSPQVFLVNQHGMISYSGSIWGQEGKGGNTEQSFLRDAIAALLSGSTPSIITTPAQGCLLKWRIR